MYTMARLLTVASLLFMLLVEIHVLPSAFAYHRLLRRGKATKIRKKNYHLFRPTPSKQQQEKELGVENEECNVTIGGITSNSSCQNDRDFCQVEVGACIINSNSSTKITGVCLERSLRCPRIFRPVCGCNNVTYPNDCEAYGRGVNIATVGSCS